MSTTSVNIFALFTIFSLVTCIVSGPPSIPERPQQDALATKVTCGTVNFMVTTYIPKPHATAFCNAYLQVPHNADSSAAETSTKKAYRKASVPEYLWLRERQSQASTRSTVLAGPCSCLSQPQAAESPATPSALSNETTSSEDESAELVLREAAYQLRMASKVIIESGLTRANVSLETLVMSGTPQPIITARPIKSAATTIKQLAVASSTVMEMTTISSNMSSDSLDLEVDGLDLARIILATAKLVG